MVAMATKTDPAGSTLNLEPSVLLVPKAVDTHARVQIASEKDPQVAAGESDQRNNPFRNRLRVVSDARLDAVSSTAWYLFTAPSAMVEGIVVGWLNNAQRPVLEQERGFEVDGVAYKVRIDATAGALDFRGAWKNAGA